MKSGLDIRIADSAWKRSLPGIRGLCRRAAGAALEEVGAGPSPAGIAVLLTGDTEMSALNARWRGRDRPTNVLSLAAGTQPETEGVAGDIALAFGTITRESEAGGIRVEDRVAHLLVHGILHLAGHDHMQDGEAERMEAAEARALARLGVADPYARSTVLESAR